MSEVGRSSSAVTLNTKTNFVTTNKRKSIQKTDIDLSAKKQKLDVETFIKDITDTEILYLLAKIRNVNLKRARSPIDSAYLMQTVPICSMVFDDTDPTDNLDDIANAMSKRLASVDMIKYANTLLVLSSIIKYAFQSGDKPRDLLETLNSVPMHDDVQATLPNHTGSLQKVMVGNNTVWPWYIRLYHTKFKYNWLHVHVCGTLMQCICLLYSIYLIYGERSSWELTAGCLGRRKPIH